MVRPPPETAARSGNFKVAALPPIGLVGSLLARKNALKSPGKINTMRMFLWPVIPALAYTAITAGLLAYLSRDADPESVTAAWMIIGAPWGWGGAQGRYS